MGVQTFVARDRQSLASDPDKEIAAQQSKPINFKSRACIRTKSQYLKVLRAIS